MEALERRQANRIMRNAKEAERDIFELIDELREASDPETLPFDWLCAMTHLQNAKERLSICVDLVNNTIYELGRVKGGVA